MFQRKQRRFRRRPNVRKYQHRPNGGDQGVHALFSNGRARNNFNQQQSAEKLLARYNILAKEALSSGDKILSENYLQHADHFARIIETKNLNQNQNKIQNSNKPKISEEASSNNEEVSSNNKETNPDKIVEEKK